MNRTIIFQSRRFDLVSYSNGLSYALHDYTARKSMFVQGDDAATFREDWEAFEAARPGAPLDGFFAEQVAICE